jgi:PTS system nitrogen regulatory IIA component
MTEIAERIERGGIYFNIAGKTAQEAIGELIKAARLPESMDRQALLTAVLQRESLSPTAVGHGISIPHPRNPMAPSLEDERIVVGYARAPIDFGALDKKPVSIVFLIISSSQKSHLNILSRLSFLLHDESFRKILEKKPLKEELAAAIRNFSLGNG